MSCQSSSSCFAVGFVLDQGNQRPLVGRLTGSSWMMLPAPIPAAATDANATLEDVACASTTRCFAVGSYDGSDGSVMLIEQWNGTAWSVANVATPAGLVVTLLSGISCRNTTTCYAVGSAFDGTAFGPFVMRWNGTVWSRVSSPNPAGGTGGGFLDVSCASTAACFAVGSFISNTTHASQTLVARWNGTVWSVVASPNAPGTDRSMLHGVSCGTATSCFAAGRSEIGSGSEGWRTVIERWNGKTWSIVPSPNVTGADLNDLAGVSCLSATRCTAVGHSVVDANSPNTSKHLVERWNGTAWSLFPPANPGGTTTLGLAAVSCPEPGFCISVGDYHLDGHDLTLIEQWNATTWSVIAQGSSDSRLRHVSCTSPQSCFAVGDFFNGSNNNTLIERWNGSSWSTVASPNPVGTARRLSGVSCVTATLCMTVGQYVTGSTTKTLIERWDGSAWSSVASPNVGTVDKLFAVACATTSSCFAVGATSGGSTSGTLIERWNGTSWSVVGSPNRAGDNSLLGVTCLSATSCFAVGTVDTGSSSSTLIERWNGTSWSIVASPNSSDAFTHLDDVTCISGTNCFAVGGSQTFFLDHARTVIERWNGTTWSSVATPTSVFDQALSGVSCMSASGCVAVGTKTVSGGNTATLLEAWNGTNWSTAASPNAPGAADNELSSAACRNLLCVAVGSATSDLGVATLAERNS